jgi:hypothetical protein
MFHTQQSQPLKMEAEAVKDFDQPIFLPSTNHSSTPEKMLE